MMLFALLFFATQDTIGKHLAQTFALPLVIWARFTVHCLLMVVFLAPSMGLKLVRTRRPLLQIARALILVCGSLIGLAAFRIMPLAEATALIMLAPLVVALLAGRFLGETIGAGRWVAICIGFGGILLIARPGGDLSLAGTLLALTGAFAFAAYQILTRHLSATENSIATLFYTALTGSVVMSLILPWFWSGAMPGTRDDLLIASLGVCSAAGHFLMIRAFHHAPASTMSPLTYAQLLWATLLGWLVFGQFPDIWSILGMLVIAGSGLLIALSGRSGQPPTQ